jgi:sugar/nucleoside kinase (ribokinase family)
MNIVCAADCGVDRFDDLGRDQAGGIGLNVAVHARRLSGAGDEVFVLAPVGDDDEARLVREAVGAAGVTDALVERPGATSVQHITHAPDGDRLFTRFDEGVLRGFELGPAERALIARADILTMAAFGQGLDLFEQVIACPSRGLRAVDFTNANDIGDPLAFVERHAAGLHIGLFGLTPADRELIDALEALARRLERVLVVTLGAHGSLALGGARRIECPALPVGHVVDTTGAGDAFTAGFLWAYADDADLSSALAHGSLVARETLGRLGAF